METKELDGLPGLGEVDGKRIVIGSNDDVKVWDVSSLATSQ